MSSEGPYGRHGYSANPSGYGGAGSYSSNQGQGQGQGQGEGQGQGGYSAPSYGGGQGYGNASYSAPSPQPAMYGSGFGGATDIGSNDRSDEDKTKSGKKSLALESLNQNVLIWAGFFTASLFVYFLLSGGDFSFLMTYGAMARMFGFGILNVKIFKSRRATGVSIKTLQLYCLVFFFRLTSIIRHEGYLPYDKSGDWVYHFIEIVALAFTSSALYGCMVPFKSTYQGDLDRFGEYNVPAGWGGVYLAVPILIIAIFIHPSLNTDFLSDTAWTYAIYLESAALVPQLFMFQKQTSGVVELLTAHFVAALGFGRTMEFFFWIYSYHELASSAGSKLPGYLALLAQFIQLVLMLDFFYYYFIAVKSATPLVLPSHTGMGIV